MDFNHVRCTCERKGVNKKITRGANPFQMMDYWLEEKSFRHCQKKLEGDDSAE